MTKKLLVFCFFLCCIAGKTFSQSTSFQITIQDQYESAVIVVSTGSRSVTDAKGKIILQASSADFIKIDHPDYDTAQVSLTKINKEQVLKVKKNFSWKDLLTPMFYIINGGLWLILFIIFAETG